MRPGFDLQFSVLTIFQGIQRLANIKPKLTC